MVTSTTLASGVTFYYIGATNGGDTRLLATGGDNVDVSDPTLSIEVAGDLAALPNLFMTLIDNGNTIADSRVEFKLIVIGMLE